MSRWRREREPRRASSGRWIGDRRFALGERRVADVQRWALSLLDDECGGRDDLAIVLGELVGNVVVHGGGGTITVILMHGRDGLVGSLIHHKPPISWEPQIPDAVGDEISALLEISMEIDDTLIEGLADGGRGLFCVAALTAGKLETYRNADCSVLRWIHSECRCGRRT
ncbi:hypothetical protein EDD29_5756 [Actinocorallia herbida]|uniref:Anti-sigma regulatory factor (Ser/Thr protein kinase) n=1 Tax=Actinocorallia herbida TaxID=58109 RepID=A0A3N1D4T4_9ACTN|nr:hypothetical protein [Actinocorallia herbida]ROO88098.1 hypothetical protein EDD29_5756 [Actinocorallia herbida]